MTAQQRIVGRDSSVFSGTPTATGEHPNLEQETTTSTAAAPLRATEDEVVPLSAQEWREAMLSTVEQGADRTVR